MKFIINPIKSILSGWLFDWFHLCDCESNWVFLREKEVGSFHVVGIVMVAVWCCGFVWIYKNGFPWWDVFHFWPMNFTLMFYYNQIEKRVNLFTKFVTWWCCWDCHFITMFPETIMVFTKKQIHFLCSQKVSLLEAVKKSAKDVEREREKHTKTSK